MNLKTHVLRAANSRRGIPILCLSMAPLPRASAAAYTEFNNAGTFAWNAAPWNNGIPNGVDSGIISSLSGLIHGGGTITIDGTATGTTPASLMVGRVGDASLSITGGALTVSDSNSEGFAIGESGNGVVTQTGGIVTAAAVRFARGSGTGIYHLNGGTLAAGFLVKGGGSAATLNLNGGILQATASSATWLGANITTSVGAGGGVIDTQAFNVTVVPALLNGGGGGGLNKLGGGALILAGANTYTGLTTVTGGTLQIGNGDASPSLGAGSYTGGTTVAGGTLQIGDLTPVTTPGAQVLQNNSRLVFRANNDWTPGISLNVSGTGNLTLLGQANGYYTTRDTAPMSYSGSTTINLDPGVLSYQGGIYIEGTGGLPATTVLDLQAGRVFLRKNQTLAGLTGAGAGSIEGNIDANTLTLNVASGSYTYDGSLTGAGFATVSGLPSGYSLDYDYQAANQIALVQIPEPGTAAALIAGFAVLTGRRRRNH